MVRTLGRSFARLAEWQVSLLAETALETGIDPTDGILDLADEVVPRVEELQNFIWRRHVLNAASRMLAVADAGDRTTDAAVCFVDIVGYTSRSRTLSDRELVAWLEAFETATLDIVIEHERPDHQEHRRRAAHRRRHRAGRRRDRHRADPPRRRRGRRLPGGPSRGRLRRGRHPARRRVRPGRQHRGPADQRGPTGHGADRPRDVRRADRRRGRRRRRRHEAGAASRRTASDGCAGSR